ncbi:hypothetical protein Leryth_013841 [Lithospermum erythrorhizon]|nr:hypothetical protein Leryth_013841 [Lithospermum erythrorhizon]
MENVDVKTEPHTEDRSREYVTVMKDDKLICQYICSDPPPNMEKVWNISAISKEVSCDLSGLPSCSLIPAPVDSHQNNEWKLFFRFLRDYKKAAEVELAHYKLYILPPKGSSRSHATMVYKKKGLTCQYDNQRNGRLGARNSDAQGLTSETNGLPRETKNNIEVHPSYLKTLGQAHSGWIFGAIAELVDNARDAKATKLKISIDTIYSKNAQKFIPMLSVVDDGHGMTHHEIKRMISFGHKQPEADDPDRIGKFGIGFKSGAMRIGKDALVLTQSVDSRSIAFLSQTLNEGKDNLEIPIVSYRRICQFMEVDTNIQSEALSKHNLRVIKEYSPFNEYLIGEKTGLFSGKGTGTQIYIWNLDEWGSSCSLEWEDGISGNSSYHHGDIKIRSRRVRTRPGQMGREVELDYSLRAYLEVIFCDPRMKIYVQGGVVKSRPLSKTLHGTVVVDGIVMKKPVQLAIGICQLELERANCGMFLFWHGRLIEAYKRVGCMIHNGDRGRGVIGVIDVTGLMDDDQGHVWVHNNKQGFQDCEEYAELEKWLGEVTDGYVDKNVDKIVVQKGNAGYKPDHDWVQCDKCRKWRMLSSGFVVEAVEWFCYMDPFYGKCDDPEEKVKRGVITISEKRTRHSSAHQFRHEDRSTEEATFKLDRSEQIAERDAGRTPTKRRGILASRSDNDITPKQNKGGDVKRFLNRRRKAVSWSDKVTLQRNAGGGGGRTPNSRSPRKRGGGGQKNSSLKNESSSSS